MLVPYNKQFSCRRIAVAARLLVTLVYSSACVCMPGPSGSKEWLSSRPIDRLESKITRFLAAHSQARSRAIVPDSASCRSVSSLSSLFFSLLPFSFFLLLKRKLRRVATSQFFYSVPYVHRMFRCSSLLYARRNINAGLIGISLKSDLLKVSWENVYARSVAERLTRKYLQAANCRNIQDLMSANWWRGLQKMRERVSCG